MRDLALPFLLTLATCLPAPPPAGAQEARAPETGSSEPSPAVLDSVFQDLDSTHRPGCAVSVTRDGELVAARGYGMANLEYGVPIGPSSVFHVASVSKQFTAFAVELLVAEGRVSWDDDIREYVPELPDLGHRVTLDHLVHHTSGVRDQWELLIMAGWRWEADVVRQRDALDLLRRQRALNFEPGSDWLYSNSGYTLLATVVERVTGRSLRAFADERIFGPLGMDRTFFRDDHEALVPGRAYAYAPDADAAGGWKISIPDFAIVGASALFTTVEDLAKWDRSLRTGELGRAAVDGMLHRVAIGGEPRAAPHGYAHGLFVGEERGVGTVSHGGADAGYRSHVLRYPDHGLAVAVLCNEPRANPGGRARRVAELWLADALEPEPAGTPLPDDAPLPDYAALPDDAALDRLAGWYASPVNDLPLRIARDDDGGLTVATGSRSPVPLRPESDSTFRIGSGSSRVLVPGGLLAREGLGDAVVVDDAVGAPLRYVRAAPADTSPDALAEYEGWYWSDELGVFYQVRRAEDGGLEFWQRRHGALAATPMHRDAFSTYYGFLGITFARDEADRVAGFTMSGGRTWSVGFRRVERPAP